MIIHTNDIHGHIQHEEGTFGMGAVAQLKADYEEDGYEVILVDAGDWLQGSLVIDDSKGDKAVDFMNSVGYDVMAPGNHEFDYGSDVLEERAARLECPFISANIYVDETGERLFEPNAIVTLSDGTKVGFFGLDTPETKTKSSPKNTLGLTFLADEELYDCAQEQIDELKAEGCDIIVCLGHLGEADESAPNRARDVIEHTSGIDLFIDGHDHRVENEAIADKDGNEVVVVETGSALSNIGVVEFADGIPSGTIVAAEDYAGLDQVIDDEAASLAAEIDERMTGVVGSVSFSLNGERMDVRTHETNLGDLVADAVLWQATQAASTTPDAAIVNGGAIRMSVEPGDLTLRIIHDVAPFTNQIVTIEVTGAQLLEALEAATQGSPDQMGAFPQVAGITYTLDTTVPYEKGEQYPDST
ncbi:MAG: bifunctional metallophosphatase/5'-nucleotidase, partial [Atopobiaceae bacterium]|nr:bifunctional metallophosphatase/5'-nucleotidase [Atopobiaceae bacterium]